MPPKQSTSAPRGRPSNTSTSSSSKTASAATSKQKAGGRQQQQQKKQQQQQRQQEESFTAEDFADEMDEDEEDEEDDEGQPKKIPPELLARILHEFFENDGTRVTRGANEAVAKYMDVFVREAIARAAVERDSGFLEVEDLEKVAPQLLLDL